MEMERIVQALRILKVEEESKAAERRSRGWRDAWETGEADWRKIDYDIDADCGLCRSDLRGRDFRRSVSDDQFLTLFTMIVGFYFGTQAQKNRSEK